MSVRLAAIAADSARLLEVARTADLTTRVPSCPAWDLGDLVAHLAAVQRFHAAHVVRGRTDPPSPPPGNDPPDDDAALLAWFADATPVLLAALAQAGEDTPAWNFGPTEPKTSGFWPRRMALEAAVHRWDGEHAVGRETPIDPALAADGIDEVLTVHLPADLPDEPVDVRGVIEVRLTDHDARWVVELTGNHVAPTRKTPDAVLEGTASEVFLGLWGRLPLPAGPLIAALRTS